MTTSSSSYAASVRPGIVHRLDKGTTGLLVVAKVRVHFFSSFGGCELLFLLLLNLMKSVMAG